MKRLYSLVLGVGVFLAGSALLAVSVLFLTICIGALRACETVVLHWPTILLALVLMLLGAIQIGRSFSTRSPG